MLHIHTHFTDCQRHHILHSLLHSSTLSLHRHHHSHKDLLDSHPSQGPYTHINLHFTASDTDFCRSSDSHTSLAYYKPVTELMKDQRIHPRLDPSDKLVDLFCSGRRQSHRRSLHCSLSAFISVVVLVLQLTWHSEFFSQGS